MVMKILNYFRVCSPWLVHHNCNNTIFIEYLLWFLNCNLYFTLGTLVYVLDILIIKLANLESVMLLSKDKTFVLIPVLDTALQLSFFCKALFFIRSSF